MTLTIDIERLVAYSQIAGAAASLILALAVFRVTRNIARNQAITALSEGWAAYNSSMLEGDNLEEFNKFLRDGSPSELVQNQETRINFLLYMLMNCLNSTYHASKSGVLEDAFSKDILDDYLIMLKPQKDYVIDLIVARGYDADFKKFLQDRFIVL